LILTVSNIFFSSGVFFIRTSKDSAFSSIDTSSIGGIVEDQQYYDDVDLNNSNGAASTTMVLPHRNNSESHLGLNSNPKTPPAIEAFAKCMLQLEEYYQDFFPQYANAIQPFLVSVKIVDDHFYVLMYLDTAGRDFISWIHASTSFACNNVPAILISSHRRGCRTKKSAVVKSPQSLNPSNNTLRTLSIVPLGNETAKVEYELDKFLECEQKDI